MIENVTIHLDLDESLISSVFCSSEKYRNDYIAQYHNFDSCAFILPDLAGWYVSFLRPTAYQIINYCENLVGEDNVYILTASTYDYSSKINEEFGLGFKPGQIYSRDHIYYSSSSGDKVKKFKDTRNVLVDNLPLREHTRPSSYGTKSQFLYGLDDSSYVHIKPFLIDTTWSGTRDEDFKYFEEELKTKIQLACEERYDDDGY